MLVEQHCPVAVCVRPESVLRKSELFFLSLLGVETTEITYWFVVVMFVVLCTSVLFTAPYTFGKSVTRS